ncbi:unnamed protein product, partial [marine sediment metagenome]
CIQAVFGLYYRKDIFDKYGIEVPQTWEELAKTAKELNLSLASSKAFFEVLDPVIASDIA